MFKNFKTIIIATTLGVTSIGLYSINAIAHETSAMTQLVPAQAAHEQSATQPSQPKYATCKKKQYRCGGNFRKACMKYKRKHMWNLGLYRHKNLSEADAQTLVKAALLMRNRKDLQVGPISSKMSKRGVKLYVIQILNEQKNVVSTVVLNSNSGRIHPMRSKAPAQALMQVQTPENNS